ncbi:MAG: trimethylamine methyltransferase family protein [Candidatus Hydrogenedentota bacterium]|nr:MAG: trimethylamine methyltransferase family protein [Candidatus Hydrogenedentota bacterium]
MALEPSKLKKKPIATVRKGIPGGGYKPLTDSEVDQVCETSFKLLNEVGVLVQEPAALEHFEKAKAVVDYRSNTVRIPQSLVVSCLETLPSSVTLYARDESHNIVLEDSRVYVGTGGTALNIINFGADSVRPAQLQDLKSICRLVDALENIHFIVLPTYPNELDIERVDVNRFFAGLSQSSKHIMGGVYTIDGLRQVIRLGQIIAGGVDALREHPIVSIITCVMSPLKLDSHYAQLMIEAARAGVPVCVPAEPLAGATAPVTLAGTLAIQVADSLTGVVLTQIVNPGTPVVFGSVATTTDLRDMKYLGASIESGLLNAAGAQIAQRLKIPFYATAGMSDSKTIDCQCGYESALTLLLVALSGANFIHDAAGLMEFANTVSLEKYVIDDDIIGMVMRAVDGIEVNEETLAFDTIKAVGPGGNFLSERHTVKHMRKENYIPGLANRDRREQWISDGKKDSYVRAREKAEDILTNHEPLPLPDDVLHRIRQEFGGLLADVD